MSDVEFTGTETLEELEAKLEQIDNEPDEEIIDDLNPEDKPDPVSAPTTIQTGDKPQPAAADPKPEDGGQVVQPPTPGEGSKPVILAKDGVHTIPYDVLEATRERARQAEERAQQLSADAAKATQLEKELNDLKQRAVDAGVDASLLDDSGLNDEQLKELMEEYPALGKHLQALTRQISALTASPTSAASASVPSAGASPVDVALMQLPELDGWRSGDQDRWDMALVIDGRLQNDPAFAGKSLVQRFQEVERRVKAAFGDVPAQGQATIAAQADKAVAAAAATLPGSPSDIGSTVTAPTTDRAAQIAAKSGNDLLGSMASMSDAEIESLLLSLDI
ncbi:hypothetical protein P7U51_000643 [Citrobacter freundii]|uniref:Uncharacterized protein n=1 Tax=Citrobacter freundii TaxID=546 RepID=A0AAN4EQT8_CITFR|nr:hypothetical protein [Citrobacter freundii]